jgi:protein-S-isoprenylcysteine O-methyltransferase Ste14
MSLKDNWINSLLKDERGEISSKRITGIISALVLWIIGVRMAFSPIVLTVSDTLINALAMLASVGLGLSSWDKFTEMKKKVNKSIKNPDNIADPDEKY